MFSRPGFRLLPGPMLTQGPLLPVPPAVLNAVYGRTEIQRNANRARLELARREGLAPIADLAIDRWFDRAWQAGQPELVEAVRARIATSPLAGYLKAYAVFTDGDPTMPAAMTDITAPTLVMTGELDVGSTPAMAHAMAAAIADARVHIAEGLRHLPPVEAPQDYAQPLLHFLSQETTS